MEQPASLAFLRTKLFMTTRWELLRACVHVDEAVAARALGEICESYWYPVYAMIRRAGQSPHDAEDLTQEFFVKMLKGRWISYLDQSKGRFRAYLATSLRHFLHDTQRRRWTLRRGRAYRLISVDVGQAEAQYALEVADQLTPEALYEQKWAEAVISQALRQLQHEMAVKKNAGVFECFREVIFDEAAPAFYQQAATKIGVQAGTLRTAISRARQRLKFLIRDEVARTISRQTESEIDDEMRHLLRVAATGVHLGSLPS